MPPDTVHEDDGRTTRGIICSAPRRHTRPATPRVNQSHAPWRSNLQVVKWLDLVIDSGCTWHVRGNLEDLIDVRKCSNVVEDASRNEVSCTHMGDLLLAIRDNRGRELCLLLKGSPPLNLVYRHPHISRPQLWETSRIDFVCRNVKQMQFLSKPQSDGSPLCVPFRKSYGLYRWRAGLMAY